MKTTLKLNLLAAALIGVLAMSGPVTQSVAQPADPLPSWNDGPAKQSIIEFVTKVTTAGSPDFVPVPERIATFDNDGTLWCEQPVPVQLLLRARPREGARAAASRMEDQGTVRLAAQGRFENRARRRRPRAPRTRSWPRTRA